MKLSRTRKRELKEFAHEYYLGNIIPVVNFNEQEWKYINFWVRILGKVSQSSFVLR